MFNKIITLALVLSSLAIGAFAGSFSINLAKAQETGSVSEGADDATCIDAIERKIKNDLAFRPETNYISQSPGLLGDSYVVCRIKGTNALDNILRQGQ